MSTSTLHHDDVYEWSRQQARILRELASSGVRLPNDLDLENVAEEIEDVGSEQFFQAESNVRQALMHLIKIAAFPDDEAVRHWLTETIAFLANAQKRYRRSMRREWDQDQVWRDACRFTAMQFEDTDKVLPPLPKQCPIPIEDMIDERARPKALAARLAAAIAAASPRP